MGSVPLGAVSMSACLLSYGPDSLTLYSSWALLNSHTLWVHWNSVLMAHPERYVQVGLRRMVVPLSSAHVCALLSIKLHLQSTAPKIKLLEISKKQ